MSGATIVARVSLMGLSSALARTMSGLIQGDLVD